MKTMNPAQLTATPENQSAAASTQDVRGSGLSVPAGSASDIAEKIVTAIEGRFRDWLMHGEHTEARQLVAEILNRELDGWTVKSADYDRLAEAAMWPDSGSCFPTRCVAQNTKATNSGA